MVSQAERRMCHVGTEEEVILVLGKPEHQLAHFVVGLEPKPAHGHVVIDHRTGRGVHRLVGEGFLHLLHPVRFQHGIGVDPAEDIARGVVQTEVACGNEPLVAVLAEQDDRALRILQLHLPHDLRRAVLGQVVHHNDFVGRHRLVDRGDQTLPDDAFLVVRRDHNRHSRRRSKEQGILG